MGQNQNPFSILLGFAAVVSAETPTLRALYLFIPHRILQYLNGCIFIISEWTLAELKAKAQKQIPIFSERYHKD